jgi:ABC-type Fe3+-hydroxamate transport system substrate-binding protein
VLRIALVFLVLLTAFACVKRPTVPANAAGTRVVVLSPAVASIMMDLDLRRFMVGRHASDDWSDPSLPVCGDQLAVDYEHLLGAAPTHVFLQRAEIPERLAELSAARGFVVHNFSILSLDEIRLAARQIHAWGGAPGPLPSDLATLPRAPIEEKMDRAWSAHAGIDAVKVGRVLLLASIDPIGALGPGSWHDDILRRLGGTPAIVEGKAYITLDAEDVLHLAPEAILVVLPRAPGAIAAPALTPETKRELLGVIALLNIPAVRNGRVGLIDDPQAHLPSTAMIRVAEQMAAILELWSTK